MGTIQFASEPYQTMCLLLHYYFTERAVEKTLSLVTGDIHCVGASGRVALGQKELKRQLEEEFCQTPGSVPFSIFGYQEGTGDAPHCFCNLAVYRWGKHGKPVCRMNRLTVSFRREGGAASGGSVSPVRDQLCPAGGRAFPL